MRSRTANLGTGFKCLFKFGYENKDHGLYLFNDSLFFLFPRAVVEELLEPQHGHSLAGWQVAGIYCSFYPYNNLRICSLGI